MVSTNIVHSLKLIEIQYFSNVTLVETKLGSQISRNAGVGLIQWKKPHPWLIFKIWQTGIILIIFLNWFYLGDYTDMLIAASDVKLIMSFMYWHNTGRLTRPKFCGKTQQDLKRNRRSWKHDERGRWSDQAVSFDLLERFSVNFLLIMQHLHEI